MLCADQNRMYIQKKKGSVDANQIYERRYKK